MMYGLTERQFANLFIKAGKFAKVSMVLTSWSYSTSFDNMVYRLG